MGSRPIRPTILPSETLLKFALWLRRTKRNKENTIEIKVRKIKYLHKHVNLWDVEAVSEFIQDGTWSGGYKESLEYTYSDWCRFHGFDYKPHSYPRISKLPYIPTETELDTLIVGAKNEYACYLQLLKETGWRPSEALTLTPLDIHLERRVATLNSPKKGSNPRQVKLSNKLIAMMTPIVTTKKSKEILWQVSRQTIAKNINRLKKRLAKKLGNPMLSKITLYTFRHWKATMEYHRTKDILYVKELLGHKDIKNTLVYTHLVSFESDDWVCKVASSLEEAVELIEAGFEYVTEYEGKKMFRKRK